MKERSKGIELVGRPLTALLAFAALNGCVSVDRQQRVPTTCKTAEWAVDAASAPKPVLTQAQQDEAIREAPNDFLTSYATGNFYVDGQPVGVFESDGAREIEYDLPVVPDAPQQACIQVLVAGSVVQQYIGR